MSFSIRVPSLITPVHCITQTEEPKKLVISRKIVFNSSPLLFLSRLGFLEKFLESNDNFYLPVTVQQEINAKQDQSSETLNKLIDQQKLTMLNIQLISLANSWLF